MSVMVYTKCRNMRHGNDDVEAMQRRIPGEPDALCGAVTYVVWRPKSPANTGI